MAISPCPATDVNPRCGVDSSPTPAEPDAAHAPTATPARQPPPAVPRRLPVNDAPYTAILYADPVTGRRRRSRITAELRHVRFEECTPIRSFPAYRGRRSHQGWYWFSRSQSHVRFESRFEMAALMTLDFRAEAKAVSSNPFWLLWPKGTTPMRHAPDFFVRRGDGSVLIVDVKPAERITDKDRQQHDQTRQCCGELGWDYEEFTELDAVVERNLRLLSGYHHPRFAAPDHARALIHAQVRHGGQDGMRLADLVEIAGARSGLSADGVICAIYHMLWNSEVHSDLTRVLTWNALVRP